MLAFRLSRPSPHNDRYPAHSFVRHHTNLLMRMRGAIVQYVCFVLALLFFLYYKHIDQGPLDIRAKFQDCILANVFHLFYFQGLFTCM